MQEIKISQLADSHLTKCYFHPSARAGLLVSQKSVGWSCAVAHPSFSLSLRGESASEGAEHTPQRPFCRGTMSSAFLHSMFLIAVFARYP